MGENVTELGRRLHDVGIDGCKLRLDRRRPNVVINSWYTLVGQPVANDQKRRRANPTTYVEPTYNQRLHFVWLHYYDIMNDDEAIVQFAEELISPFDFRG